MKRLIGLVFALMVLVLPGVKVWAADQTPVSYMVWDDTNKVLKEAASPCSSYTTVENQTTWGNTNGTTWWYVVSSPESDSLTISDRITVTGTVNLILCDGAKLTASKGINVSAGNALNIYAQSFGDNMGKLCVEMPTDDSTYSGLAAIGGDKGSESAPGNCGTIIINGGMVMAASGSGGAGIGGGENGSGGTITINGGTVIATGGDGAEGIGHGTGSSVSGTLTIGKGIIVYANDSSMDGIETKEKKLRTSEPGTDGFRIVTDNRQKYMKATSGHVFKVSILSESSEVAIGDDKASLCASIDPDNAGDKTVKWTVDNDNVKLYSDENCNNPLGLTTAIEPGIIYVKGIKEGKAKITATSNEDPDIKDSVEITVFKVGLAFLVQSIHGSNVGDATMESNEDDGRGRFTSGDAIAGSKLIMRATAKSGYRFVKWEASSGTFENPTSAETIYTVGRKTVTINVYFEPITAPVISGGDSPIGGDPDPSRDPVPASSKVTDETSPAYGKTTDGVPDVVKDGDTTTTTTKYTDGSVGVKTEQKTTDGTVIVSEKISEKDGSWKQKDTEKAQDGSTVETEQTSDANGDNTSSKTVKTDALGKVIESETISKTVDNDTKATVETHELKNSEGTLSEKTTTQENGDYESVSEKRDPDNKLIEKTESSKTANSDDTTTLFKKTTKGDNSSESQKATLDKNGTGKIDIENDEGNGSKDFVSYDVTGNKATVSDIVVMYKMKYRVPSEIIGLDGITRQVNMIGMGACEGQGLASVNIPSTIEKVGNGAFKDTGMTEMAIEGSVSKDMFGKDSLKGCGKLRKKTSNSLLEAKDKDPKGKGLTIYVQSKKDQKALKKQLKKAGAPKAKVKIAK